MGDLVPSPTVVAAARALGVAGGSLVPIGGRTGETWGVGKFVMRVRPTALLDAELAAMGAAADAVPVSSVADRADIDGVSAALMRRLPGVPAAAVGDLTPAEAGRRGRACGKLHLALAGVVAPAGYAPATLRGRWPGAEAPPDGDRLLHLDLHPFNVLVDGESVTGVVDWANARAGAAPLDQARTLSILTLDPIVGPWRRDPRVAALIDGWIEGGELDTLAPRPLAWAYRFMLDDLAKRYRADELAGIRSALAAVEGDPA